MAFAHPSMESFERIGLGDMQALGGEILDHGRGVAGDDAMAAIAQATGLDRYM